MVGKLTIGAVAILVAALLAYLGHLLISSYGKSRYEAGLASGELRAMPQIIAAHDAATQVMLTAQARAVRAEQRYGDEAARIAALDQQSNDEVSVYETSDSGRAACLDAERVRGIEAARTALFSGAPVPDDQVSGSMPAGAAQHDG